MSREQEEEDRCGAKWLSMVLVAFLFTGLESPGRCSGRLQAWTLLGAGTGLALMPGTVL
mgnify:CR=1 FL=1